MVNTKILSKKDDPVPAVVSCCRKDNKWVVTYTEDGNNTFVWEFNHKQRAMRLIGSMQRISAASYYVREANNG